MVVYNEETVPEGKVPIARGKVEWYQEQDVKHLVPSLVHLFHEKPDKTKLLLLKEEIIKTRTKQGVVYFDGEHTVYRYKVSTSGKLKDFAINFGI